MHDERYNDLAKVKKLAIVCESCGRRRIWREHQIAAAQVRHCVHSALQLGSKLKCTSCDERGFYARNVSIYVDPVDDLAAGVAA